MEEYLTQRNPSISLLECDRAWELLSSKEKKYAHYLARGAATPGLPPFSSSSPRLTHMLLSLALICSFLGRCHDFLHASFTWKSKNLRAVPEIVFSNFSIVLARTREKRWCEWWWLPIVPGICCILLWWVSPSGMFLIVDNVGNYLSFGDSKFVPRCPQEVFENIIKAAEDSVSVLCSITHRFESHLTVCGSAPF